MKILEDISLLHHNQDVLIDARSEAEFEHAHIPGALNLPLLNNSERHTIGIAYKEHGRDEAVRLAFEMIGPQFSSKILHAREIVPFKKATLYCWRGGMRSNTLGWLLELAGFDITIVKGGYKTFRHWVLEELKRPKKVVVLSGKTGSGKTEILDQLAKAGCKTINLESLAHHKGSAFGALGQVQQTPQEQFENNLAWHWSQVVASEILWLEDESRWIGRNKIPDFIYDSLMQKGPLVLIERSHDERRNRILSEYGNFPVEVLAERTATLARRMGGLQNKNALQSLRDGNMNQWAELMLEYYDRTYDYCLARRGEFVSKRVPVDYDARNQIQQIVDAGVEVGNAFYKNSIA